MAKFLSQVYTVIRGSVGGVTYLAGPNHALIARARVAPTNPSTIYQQNLRGAWGYVAGLWMALSGTERTRWQQYAASVTFQSPTGPYTVTGRQLFMAYYAAYVYMTNRSLIIYGNTSSPTTPGALATPTATYAPLPATGDGFQLTINNPNPVSVVAYARISPVCSVIRNSWKGPFDAASLLGSTIITTGANGTLNFSGLITAGIYFAQIGLSTTGTDNTHRLPIKLASPLIFRAIATHTT